MSAQGAEAEQCPCVGDTYPPPCWARAPSGKDWARCTRSQGHFGDHIYCGGGAYKDGKVFHGIERWPRGAD